jgi:hypothetical protein
MAATRGVLPPTDGRRTFFVAVQVVVCVVDGIICDVFWPKGRAISKLNRIFAV